MQISEHKRKINNYDKRKYIKMGARALTPASIYILHASRRRRTATTSIALRILGRQARKSGSNYVAECFVYMCNMYTR